LTTLSGNRHLRERGDVIKELEFKQWKREEKNAILLYNT